jgi:diaminopimelate decarboxylase
MVKRTLGHLNLKYVLEPGRMIVGNAGIMVSRVIYVKDGTEKDFVIQDAAMNDLIRPTLYDAYHEIIPVAEPTTSRNHDGRCRRPRLRVGRLSRESPAGCRSWKRATLWRR